MPGADCKRQCDGAFYSPLSHNDETPLLVDLADLLYGQHTQRELPLNRLKQQALLFKVCGVLEQEASFEVDCTSSTANMRAGLLHPILP